MLDLALKEFNFGFGEVEQGKHAVVQFGFGVGKIASLTLHLGPLFCQVGLPLVGRARVLQRVGTELEAGLQRRTELTIR